MHHHRAGGEIAPSRRGVRRHFHECHEAAHVNHVAGVVLVSTLFPKTSAANRSLLGSCSRGIKWLYTLSVMEACAYGA